MKHHNNPMNESRPLTMDNTQTKRMLATLYLRVLEEGVRLRISGAGNSDGEEGFFHPQPPQIEVFLGRGSGFVDLKNVETIAQASIDPQVELVVLAHEFGHFLSYKTAIRTAHYDKVILTPLSQWDSLHPSDKKTILNEERTAWDFAREVLRGIGFSDWSSFETKASASLQAYNLRLGLD